MKILPFLFQAVCEMEISSPYLHHDFYMVSKHCSHMAFSSNSHWWILTGPSSQNFPKKLASNTWKAHGYITSGPQFFLKHDFILVPHIYIYIYIHTMYSIIFTHIHFFPFNFFLRNRIIGLCGWSSGFSHRWPHQRLLTLLRVTTTRCWACRSMPRRCAV